MKGDNGPTMELSKPTLSKGPLKGKLLLPMFELSRSNSDSELEKAVLVFTQVTLKGKGQR